MAWPLLAGLPACATLDDQTPPIPIAARIEDPKPKPVPPQRPGDVQLVKAEATATAPPVATDGERPFSINLPTALALAGANPLDVQIADERVRQAAAELDRANVL